MSRNNQRKKAFTLIEFSIVILVIGIVVAAILGGNYLYNKSVLASARSLTQSSILRSFRELYLWLETASETSISDSDRENGSVITAWNNSSNVGSIVTTISGTDCPTYLASGMNRTPAIRFNGNDNCYVSTDGTFMNGLNLTILMSYQPEAADAGNLITSGDSEFSLVINGNGTAVQLIIQGTPILSASLEGYTPGVPRSILVTLTDDGAEMYIDDTLVASSNDTTKPANISTLYIGRGYTGQIGELAILLK